MKNKQWIKSPVEKAPAAVTFQKRFFADGGVRTATLRVSAMGVYQAHLNGERIGRQVLTPGWTSYRNRVQYQTFKLNVLSAAENVLTISLANGWARGQMGYRRDIPDI